jgi:hypothetical protein
MRKMLSIILAAGIIFGLTATAMAVQNPDYGYVIVRCTVTLSVDVEDNATAYFSTGNEPDRYVISAGLGFDYVSISSITIKNDSVGAICKWALQVSTIQYSESYPFTWQGDNRWKLVETQSDEGIHEAILYGVFASSRPSLGEFATVSTFTVGTDKLWAHTITAGSAKSFDPNSTTSGFQYAQPSIPGYDPGTIKAIKPGDRRALWFRFVPPKAVVDEYYRRFVIQVTASLHGQ